MRFRCLFLFGMAFVVVTSDSATAHDGYWNVAAGWWPGPRAYTQEHIPYFAKHPPVYYSRPITRPYGYVPYAYWPEKCVPQVVVAQPVVVRNHYVAGDAVDRWTEEPSPAGRRIINPFVREREAPLPSPDEVPLFEPEA